VENWTKLFDLTGRVAIITGGAGLLGTKHAEIIAAAGGLPVLIDLPETDPAGSTSAPALGLAADITDLAQVESVRATAYSPISVASIS
jgi:NAD(P)-dependent dehydrogenase (short-subunit alcohol dehydrogenase family)